MIFKTPKAADPAEALLKKAMNSDDSLLKIQATQYFLDMVAERCQSPADLYQILAAIPDKEQRYMVLDGLKPLLKFSIEGIVFEEEDPDPEFDPPMLPHGDEDLLDEEDD